MSKYTYRQLLENLGELPFDMLDKEVMIGEYEESNSTLITAKPARSLSSLTKEDAEVESEEKITSDHPLIIIEL
jgi:hypothetical protein